MVKNSESKETESKSNIEYYKNILKLYVLDEHAITKISEEEMERYISVFSLYLRESNKAYKYNLPYLISQHKKHTEFLQLAKQKAKTLQYIIKGVNESESIQKGINNENIKGEEIKVSINDFLIMDLSGKIEFHSSFSLTGAARKPEKEKDIITIKYKEQVRAIKLSDSTKAGQKENEEKTITNKRKQLTGVVKSSNTTNSEQRDQNIEDIITSILKILTICSNDGSEE